MSFSPRIPILMYHSVSDSDDYGDLPTSLRPLGYRVTAAEFRGHLEVLREGGWSTIQLGDLAAAGEGRGDLPARPLILTFDDGYADNLQTVLPLLRDGGFRAVFFLSVSHLGRPGMLTWAGAGELLGAGMEIGSHGMGHDILSDRSERQLRWELEESRRILGEKLGSEVRYFSLPRGYLPPALPRLARAAGYRGLCTSRPGFNAIRTDPFRLRRFPIRTGLTRRKLIFLLSGRGLGYAKIYSSEMVRNLGRIRHRIVKRGKR
jgi:peptidoglycan/xylan/chitin deacetylase (PgdA/CDA1 family)